MKHKEISLIAENDTIIALAGNPNTGKSTLFNMLTGLRQHTGNWPGKTVFQAKGSFIYKGKKYVLVDLPGTYSLLASSVEEKIARDFICFGRPDATVVVLDATCLERNLNLALQVMEISERIIVCINLIDEARRKHLDVDTGKLSETLGMPVVATAARNGEGLAELLKVISEVVAGNCRPKPKTVRYSPEIEKAVAKLKPKIKNLLGDQVNPRWIALRLLEGDTSIEPYIKKIMKNKVRKAKLREVLA